jgi:hypothetical protein
VLVTPNATTPLRLLATCTSDIVPLLEAELWNKSPFELLEISVVATDSVLTLFGWKAIPFVKPRITLSRTLSAAPELNCIPFVPEPTPSISNPAKLMTSFAPALIVIPLTFVASTPAMP